MIDSMSSKLEFANARLTEELKSAQAANEKALLELFNAKEENHAAEKKVREELTSKIDELQKKLNISTGRQANSSIKGKDNEDALPCHAKMTNCLANHLAVTSASANYRKPPNLATTLSNGRDSN